MKKIILCPLLVALLGGCNGGTSNSSTPSLNQSLTTLNSMNGAIPVICNANVQKWQENYTYKNVNTLVIYNGSEFFNNSITNERPDISNQWILLGSCSKESIISPSKVLLNESNNCLNAKLTYQNIGNPWYINYEVSIQNSCSDEKSLKDFSVSMISQSLDGVAIPLPTIHNWWVNGTQYDLAYNSENLLQTGFIINPINAIIKSNQTISFTGGIGLNGVSYDVETAQKSFKYTGATPTPTPNPTPTPSPSPSDYPIYPNGLGTYEAGTIVQAQGNLYKCLSSIVVNWCNSPAIWAYEPGVGADWNSAWEKISTPTPTPTPVPSPSPTPSPAIGYIYSPYKDVSLNYDWNSNIVSAMNNGILTPLTNIAKNQNMSVFSLAFATGECGNENWGGIKPEAIKNAITQLNSANIKYIVSTGGANGSFTCSSDAGMQKFLNNYITSGALGIDFDIEGAGLSIIDLNNLITELKYAQLKYPNLRLSFTLATLGDNHGNSVNNMGAGVVNAVKKSGLKNVTYNLMAMDYGTGEYACIMSNGVCDMNLTAQAAATNFHNGFGIPYSQIELTPMIGVNDVAANVFSLTDAKNLNIWVKQVGLGGLHYWSLDRDNPCNSSWASATCSSSVNGKPSQSTQYEFYNALK